ncbi:uncharacterized protein LOC105208181 [Solenopsis invicta]|uniref:uncharacterized protein LOC105208181 n=1 Tax=Solenopsis invicta TaxID=13686 RepID=UPI000596057A|nr:uncharacterized protein LOC105208181 [Solenopsis invicta]
MAGTAGHSKFKQFCTCRNQVYAHSKKKTKDRCKKKRQIFVYNPEEEIWHEPYMQTLRHEFSDKSVICDSMVELPWKDIALSTAMKIRPDTTLSAAEIEEEMDEAETKTISSEKQKFAMTLPWRDLLITEIVGSTLDDPETCDSSVEIPWTDLTLEKPIEIRPSREEQTCASDDVEIPWNEILVPRNIVIKPERKRKHPSSNRPPRPRVDATCITCVTPTCYPIPYMKTLSKTHAKTNIANPKNPSSNWILACM